MIEGGKMKKLIISCLILIILVIGIIFGTKNWKDKKDNDNLTHVTVAEVTHSIFYAPQYLADSLGYFEEEGLDVEITLTAGADAVMAAVLSKDADIGLCGTEATI
ncbi:MAG: ABC transporter substrate-binding protein [Erysipelotrichaceae bacterium]|nr:ABC transporter substrate-binding protein [Erysipelotrichaceae bacterium]